MAKEHTIDEVSEWQLTKNTASERIKYLYRNPLMADVHFIVADKEGSSLPKVTIPCHKFVLAVTSPVFFRMFYGELRGLKECIDLPDCDSEGLLEFLRFVYCDEVKLTGSCVMQVLYLAKKYMIPTLSTRCRSFLEANINAENVLEVLSAVEKMDEAHLNGVCWKIVDTNVETILQSSPDSFLEDNERLVSILKRDTLEVKEVEVFQAVNRWAESICTKRGITPSGKEKRKIIGEEILTLIRFPLMPQKVFAEHVTESKILTETETIQMFMYFNLQRNPGEFSCIPRCLNSKTVRRCQRFSGVTTCGYMWKPPCECDDSDFIDSISFTVNIPIALGGIRLLGTKGRKYDVKLKLNGEIVLEDRCLTAEKGLSSPFAGFDIIFGQCYLLNPDEQCVLVALIKGPRCAYGTVRNEEVVYENVSFRFVFTEDDRKAVHGRTGVKGQIQDILFKHLGSNS